MSQWKIGDVTVTKVIEFEATGDVREDEEQIAEFAADRRSPTASKRFGQFTHLLVELFREVRIALPVEAHPRRFSGEPVRGEERRERGRDAVQD